MNDSVVRSYHFKFSMYGIHFNQQLQALALPNLEQYPQIHPNRYVSEEMLTKQQVSRQYDEASAE